MQDFIPVPFDVATAMYHTGIDPFTGKKVHVARGMKERRQQRALLQYFKPENWREVRDALIQAGRQDLIGGKKGLIPAEPPRGAKLRRRSSTRPR